MADTQDEHIHQHLDENGDLEPPWARHPDYTRFSIGWRMGVGETWMELWHAWLSKLPTDLETRRAYLQRQPPAPLTWFHTVHSTLSPGDENDTPLNGTFSQKQLLQWGFLGHDVAYANWQRYADECILQLTDTHKTPNLAARYSTRSLSFFLRYGVEKREAGEFKEWFKTLPSFHEEWLKLFLAWGNGEQPHLPALKKGYRRLIFELALFGEARPPWKLGLDPETYTDDIDMDIEYTDAWAHWIHAAFDDYPSLHQYFERYGGQPEEWDDVVDEATGGLPL
ncbi:MAG: hypothetical protein EP343_33935 [Deltaproteobacteria bacterium]|nr:MAG: hypothetical protein EP343_33935 [Deltaproteobacteria bacterium]